MFSWVYLLYLKDSKCAKYRHQGTADRVTFIKEILDGKPYLLRNDQCNFDREFS